MKDRWRVHSPEGTRRWRGGRGTQRRRGDSWLNYLVAMIFPLPAPGSGEARVFCLPWGPAISCSLVTPLPVSQKELLFFLYQTFPNQHSMVFNPCAVLTLIITHHSCYFQVSVSWVALSFLKGQKFTCLSFESQHLDKGLAHSRHSNYLESTF